MANKLEGPLFDVGLTYGVYAKLDPKRIKHVYRDKQIPDPEGLLDKVMRPETMEISYHGKLLSVLSREGYDSADQNVAIGPVLDEKGQRVPGKMRFVHYMPKRSFE